MLVTALILRRLFRVVDHQNRNRPLARFQLETKLLRHQRGQRPSLVAKSKAPPSPVASVTGWSAECRAAGNIRAAFALVEILRNAGGLAAGFWRALIPRRLFRIVDHQNRNRPLRESSLSPSLSAANAASACAPFRSCEVRLHRLDGHGRKGWRRRELTKSRA
jgi:hypothetical protein